jgi:hypothetical protein
VNGGSESTSLPSAEIKAVIDGFRQVPSLWSEPFDRLNHFVDEHPESVTSLALAMLDALPEGGTFFDSLISSIPVSDLFVLVERAVMSFAAGNRLAAESVFDRVSLQHPAAPCRTLTLACRYVDSQSQRYVLLSSLALARRSTRRTPPTGRHPRLHRELR